MRRKEMLSNFKSLDNKQIKELTADYLPESEIINRIHCSEPWNGEKPDVWWRTGYTGKLPAVNEKLFLLRDKLLSIGGSEVCLPAFEEDIDNILEYGQLWDGHNPIVKKGRPCRCHQNSCDLWYANKDEKEITICTGYALSDDGIWRQHSWLVWAKPRSNKIIETTVKREAYFGFPMTYEQCVKFDDENF